VTADWLIVYDGGGSFSSLDGPPEAAPRWGALCVALADVHVGRTVWHGGSADVHADFFCWTGDTWVPRDRDGLLDHLLHTTGVPGVVVQGRAVSGERFRAAYRIAETDPRLPPKSGYRPEEPLLP
jgi:hypothetical protein